MAADRFERWLADEIGLDASSIGSNAVADAVRRRMTARGLADEDLYFARLKSMPDEQQSFIETVVVPETWFFRDGAPFALLGRWAAAVPAGSLRVLSAPCASGEEPYSAAISLLEAGLAPGSYRIDAIDISLPLLHKARTGLYGPYSFRGVSDSLRQRYFLPQGGKLALRRDVCRGVHFTQGNLLAPGLLARAERYDVILCRNLLIYETCAARELIIAFLERNLKENGLLFVGHAETMLVTSPRFTPVRESRAFAFRKEAARAAVVTVPDGNGTAGSRRPADRLRKTRAPVRRRPAEHRRGPAGRAVGAADIARAMALADKGRLQEAASICEQLIGNGGARPEVLFLLGIIREAENRPDAAEEMMKRALHMDAAFPDAALHLALLKEKRAGAKVAEQPRGRAAGLRRRRMATI